MSRKDQIRNAYKVTGESASFYDGMREIDHCPCVAFSGERLGEFPKYSAEIATQGLLYLFVRKPN